MSEEEKLNEIDSSLLVISNSLDKINSSLSDIDRNMPGTPELDPNEGDDTIVYRLLMDACIKQRVLGKLGDERVERLKDCHESSKKIIKDAKIWR